MNKRGELWVIGQFVIGALIVVAPPSAPLKGLGWLRLAGGGLFLLGGVVLLLAAGALGRNLTPFPKPRPGGQLVEHGLYAHVRHPIYFGVLLLAFGWALLRQSGWGTLLSGALLLFLDVKARREEAWLREQYEGYAAYQRRVKKLIPWLY